MRSYWKDEAQSLRSQAEWRERIAKKNRQPGTSAPTLASVWAGPVELHGALSNERHLADVRVTRVVVERESHFDAHGGPRNHDLVVHGHLPDGETVVACVEAKAGEQLDRTVERYGRDARNKARAGSRRTRPSVSPRS